MVDIIRKEKVKKKSAKKLRQKFGLPKHSGRSLWKLHAKARYLVAEVNITLRDQGLVKSKFCIVTEVTYKLSER